MGEADRDTIRFLLGDEPRALAGADPTQTPPIILRRCGECRNVAYCSVDCQKKHYPSHRITCRREDIPFGIPRLLSLPRERLVASDVAEAVAMSFG